jgi:hypothetical protein
MHTTRQRVFTYIRVLIVVAVLAFLVVILVKVTMKPSLPDPVGQDCGTITYSYRTVSGGPAGCLWHAYQTCQTATLTYTNRGVDTGVTHVVIVQRGDHGCAVSDSVDSWSDNGPGRHDVSSYTCAGMRAPTTEDLALTGCGAEGDVQLVFIGPTPLPTVTAEP